MAKNEKLSVSKSERTQLFGASNYINSSIEEKLGLLIPFDIYLQDPSVAENESMFGFSENFLIKWEPNLSDGPTSSRFAVMDYDANEEELFHPAKWDDNLNKYVFDDKVLDMTRARPVPISSSQRLGYSATSTRFLSKPIWIRTKNTLGV